MDRARRKGIKVWKYTWIKTRSKALYKKHTRTKGTYRPVLGTASTLRSELLLIGTGLLIQGLRQLIILHYRRSIIRNIPLEERRRPLLLWSKWVITTKSHNTPRSSNWTRWRNSLPLQKRQRIKITLTHRSKSEGPWSRMLRIRILGNPLQTARMEK